jgi:two-component system, NtrC family, sensor kinase
MPIVDDSLRAASGSKRILVVDDSESYLHQLGDLLGSEGYDVVLARSGEEAIEALSVQSVDCILLDLVMPGLGGNATCRFIKASPAVRDVPVILVTALEDRESMVEGLSLGADDYVSKSSGFEVLEARVRAQMRRKQFEVQHRRVREQLLQSELSATQERAAREIAETRAALVGELERKNSELESFSHAVSHDLRAPLRAIDGFTRALLDEFGPTFDPRGREYLDRVLEGTRRMGELIEDLLALSRVGRAELHRARVDLSAMARAAFEEIRQQEPARAVTVAIQEGLAAEADARLMRIVFDNLLGNAWKFTAKVTAPRIEFVAEPRDGGLVYFVRDNGAGFDMAFAEQLFAPFQRLHREVEFPGTGIGLATVYRVLDRHGGRVWAESAVGRGATFFFTLPVT